MSRGVSGATPPEGGQEQSLHHSPRGAHPGLLALLALPRGGRAGPHGPCGGGCWHLDPCPLPCLLQVAVPMGKALLEFVWALRFHGDA